MKSIKESQKIQNHVGGYTPNAHRLAWEANSPPPLVLGLVTDK
jgi:hypothetical protein